jgi:protein-S-isoprenylcysteine O-methyltransferase Ste14
VSSRLAARSAAGFAFLMLVLALALFVPAGTTGYWQAWLYLAVFAACTVFITIYLARNDPRLLESRVAAGPVAETRRSQQLIQSLASLLFLGLFVVAGLDARFGWSAVPPAVSVAADGLVALAFLGVFLVFRENSYTSAVIEVASGQRVVTTGPYRLVRHPMYAGASLLLLATPVALGSWAALPLAGLLILVIAARALDEERYLAEHLDGYAAYLDRVRYRLLPGIW